MHETHTQRHFTSKFTTDEEGNPILEIPDEVLDALDWVEGDSIEISVFFDRIIFKRVME